MSDDKARAERSLTPEERAREIGDPGDTLLHYIIAGHIRAAEHAAEARGRERALTEALHVEGRCYDDCLYLLRIRALLSAEPQATPPSSPAETPE